MTEPAQTKKLVTVAEAAERLGVSERSVREWLATGRIRRLRLSSRAVRIDPDDLQAFVDGHGRGGGAAMAPNESDGTQLKAVLERAILAILRVERAILRVEGAIDRLEGGDATQA